MNANTIAIYLLIVLPIIAVINTMSSAYIIVFGTPIAFVYSNLMTYAICVIIYFDVFGIAKVNTQIKNTIMKYFIRMWYVMFCANVLYGIVVLYPAAGWVIASAKIIPEIVLTAPLFLYVKQK